MSSLRIENSPWQGQEAPQGTAGVRGQEPNGDTAATTSDPNSTPPAGGVAPSGGFGDMLPMMAIFAIAVWFLIIRPQQKQEKARKAMVEAMKKGDKVVTTGGLHGVVQEIQENTVIVDLGPVNLTVSRTAVTVVNDGEAVEAKK